MIKSFADDLTAKIYNDEVLTKRDRRKIGALNLDKAQERLAALAVSDEKALLMLPSLHYHKLHGTDPQRYSIDADSRRSPWRITFQWASDDLVDVELVKIEDNH